MMHSSPDVLVIIVNYRSAALTLHCLETLRDEIAAHGAAHVRVVENDSGDGEALRRGISERGFESWVSLDIAPKNGGFAYGNNRGIRPFLESASPPRFFWLLNPDTEVLAGAMTALVDHLKSTPKAGIAGSRLLGSNGAPYEFAYRFPSILSELDNGLGFGPVARLLRHHRVLQPMGPEAQPIDWLPGASMMIRREVLETIGYMDETYFLYFEETDFCKAAARAGWETWDVPASKIVHVAGGSTGFSIGGSGSQRRFPSHWFDSRRHYFTKNHGLAYAAVADVVQISALSMGILRRFVDSRVIRRRKHVAGPPHILQDTIVHSMAGQAVKRTVRRLTGDRR